MKWTTLLVVAAMMAGQASAFDVNWGTDSPRIFDSGGIAGGNYVIGAWLDPSGTFTPPFTGYEIGGFCQLIRVVGTMDTFDPSSPTGVTDDQVVGTSWMGEGQFGDPIFGQNDSWRNGAFASTASMSASAGDTFYFRIFDSPSPDYSAGLIPTTGFYTDVTGWPSLTADDIQTGSREYVINTDQETMTPVPEPGTLALLGLGMIVLAARRKLS